MEQWFSNTIKNKLKSVQTLIHFLKTIVLNFVTLKLP